MTTTVIDLAHALINRAWALRSAAVRANRAGCRDDAEDYRRRALVCETKARAVYGMHARPTAADMLERIMM